MIIYIQGSEGDNNVRILSCSVKIIRGHVTLLGSVKCEQVHKVHKGIFSRCAGKIVAPFTGMFGACFYLWVVL